MKLGKWRRAHSQLLSLLCSGISGNDPASTKRSFLKLPSLPPSKHWSLALLSAYGHLRIILFSEFRLLQHQVQSPCGPRRKLLSTKPSSVKSPTPTPPTSRSQAILGRRIETIAQPLMPVVASDGGNFILGCAWEM